MAKSTKPQQEQPVLKALNIGDQVICRKIKRRGQVYSISTQPGLGVIYNIMLDGGSDKVQFHREDLLLIGEHIEPETINLKEPETVQSVEGESV